VQTTRIERSRQATTIVRSTQFHTHLGRAVAAAGRWHLLPSAETRFRTFVPTLMSSQPRCLMTVSTQAGTFMADAFA
jgi:hypothetical protein